MDEAIQQQTTSPKKRKIHRDYDSITEEEFIKIIEYIHSKKVLVACLLAYGSGMRIQEILNLEPDDIRGNIITIRQGKGGKDRKTNKPQGFKEEYRKLLPLKDKITKMGIQKSFHKATMDSKINKIIFTYKTKGGKERNKYRLHFHCLRHSFATRAIEKGVPINQVQLLLGHSNVSTTSKYIRANPIDAIQNIIDKGV